MQRIDSIVRAFFSTLKERAEANPFAHTTTLKPQTESASSTLYTAGVLVSDLVSSVFLYFLILALRKLNKMPGVTHRVSLSR